MARADDRAVSLCEGALDVLKPAHLDEAAERASIAAQAHPVHQRAILEPEEVARRPLAPLGRQRVAEDAIEIVDDALTGGAVAAIAQVAPPARETVDDG